MAAWNSFAGLRWPPITRQHLEMNEVQMDRMVEVAREAPPLDCAEPGLRHGRGGIEQLAVDRPHVPAVLVDGAEVECTTLRGVVRIQQLDRCQLIRHRAVITATSCDENRMIWPVAPVSRVLSRVASVPTGYAEKSTTTSNRSPGATVSAVCEAGRASRPLSLPTWTRAPRG